MYLDGLIDGSSQTAHSMVVDAANNFVKLAQIDDKLQPMARFAV